MKSEDSFRVPSRQVVRALAVALVAFHAGSAYAQWKYDERQAALLPPYCKYTQLYRDAAPGGKNPAAIEKWAAVMGGDANFMHLHHYCWGLEYTNSAMYGAGSKGERNELFRISIPEFDYVIREAKPDFVLLPEILTKKGENLLRIGRAAEAFPALNRAMELKPQYWPPYVALSDYFKDLGQPAAAREWLEKGLAAAPNTQPLLRRLADLERAKQPAKSR